MRGINKKEVGKGKRILGPCGGYHPSPDFILSMVYKFLHCDATHVPCKKKNNLISWDNAVYLRGNLE